MRHFSIDSDNNITVLIGEPVAKDGTEFFSTENQLARLAVNWPISRLVEIWNSFAGVTPFADLKPVAKFENKAKGIARIWKACQTLAAHQPEEAKEATPAPPAPKGAKKARQAGKATTAAGNGAGGGKKGEIVAMLQRPGGATLAEIMKAAGWQAHSVRGFIAGAVKKMGFKVESTKSTEGARTYAIVG